MTYKCFTFRQPLFTIHCEERSDKAIHVRLKQKLKKIIFIAAGFVFVGLGAIGIFLPLLPTTPFLVLAAFLFSKTSEKFHKWLLGIRMFGPYLAHYESGTGVPKSLKIKTIALLWPSLAISAIIISAVWAWILLAVVGMCVTAHVVTIGSKKPRDK